MKFPPEHDAEAAGERIPEVSRLQREESHVGADLMKKLESVLRDIGLEDVELDLESTTTGRVGGVVISRTFDGQSQSDRQADLWSRLEERLPQHELVQIVSLIALTPAELEEVS